MHDFLLQEENPDEPPRTAHSVKIDAYKATTNYINTHRIKLPLFLTMTELFDHVRLKAIGYMHCAVCEKELFSCTVDSR